MSCGDDVVCTVQQCKGHIRTLQLEQRPLWQAVGVAQCIVSRGLWGGRTRIFLARKMTWEQLMATVAALSWISLHFGRGIL